MKIAVRNFQIRPIIDVAGLRRIVERALQATDQRADSVSFVFVDEAKMSDYHGRYVDVPEATDVLSFPVDDVDPSGERDLGDIVICTDVAVRQARTAGHAYGIELQVLALHGILHLLGCDHERDDGEMTALEERLRTTICGAQH